MARKKKEVVSTFTIDDLQTQLAERRRFWHPARMRMDLWHLMTILVDVVQLTKPAGAKRFIGAEPHATVMLARSVLARNPLQPHVPLLDIDHEDDRTSSQDIEKLIIGANNDIDRVLWGRGMQSMRSISALQLLIRGWAVSHLVIRDDYEEKDMLTPIDYEPWDMRFFLPAFDRRGYLDSCAYESFITWGEMLSDFPELQAAGDHRDTMETIVRIDWYDRTDHAVAYQRSPSPSMGSLYTPPSFKSDRYALRWAKPPTPHGLSEIPVVCISANGLPFNYMPTSALAMPPIVGGTNPNLSNMIGNRGAMPPWRGKGGYVGDWGRSILASIEDLVPQYNETVALLSQILYNDAFGTWLTQTHTGDMTEVDVGGVNALRVGETIGRVAGISASPDLYRLLGIVRESYQRGTFSDALFGLVPFQGSGFLQTQLRNSALNALDPYIESHKMWATGVAQLLLSQLKQAKGIKWDTWGKTNDLRHFRLEANADMVRRMWPIEMKPMPALPDDMALRVDIARRMLDPNMPLASYQTVLDRVLEFGDAQKERELMFEDMAERDPVVVFLRIQQRLLARGMDELAEAFGERAFAAAFVQKVQELMAMDQAKQALMMTGSAAGGLAGAGIEGGGRPTTEPAPGASPENLPPEAATTPTEGAAQGGAPVV